jgi:hypothetical protein
MALNAVAPGLLLAVPGVHMKFLLFVTVAIFTATHAYAQDVLVQKKLNVITDEFDQVLLKTENNIKAFVDHFQVKLDSGSKITSPKVVTGTLLQPVLKISVRKCVFIVCNSIDLDAEFTLKKATATAACETPYVLLGDLRRSSALLANNYSDINTAICIKRTVTGAVASLNVVLVRASHFKSDVVQTETLKFFKLQAASLIDSISKVLLLNGAKQVTPVL